MAKKTRNFWAESLGNGLAHVQNTVDKTCEWAFEKIRETGNEELPKLKKRDNKYVYGAKKAGKKLLSFLGGVGDSFYDKYTELKQENDDKDDD